MDLSIYRAAAEDAGRRAGKLINEMAGRCSVSEKGRGDLVTSADLAAQELIRDALLGHFPTHAFLGEESKGPPAAAEFRWIVDPLDGTSNFVHGVEFYCVSIALEYQGDLVVGVLYEPCQDRLFSASAGAGAVMNGQPIRVSPVATLGEALLVTGFPPGLRGRTDLLRMFEELCSVSHAVRRTGSAALDLAYVACGRFDGFYSTHLNCWDAAAGVVLLREAGGRVTNLDGSPYDLYTPDILATNGLIHDAMAGLISQVRRELAER